MTARSANALDGLPAIPIRITATTTNARTKPIGPEATPSPPAYRPQKFEAGRRTRRRPVEAIARQWRCHPAQTGLPSREQPGAATRPLPRGYRPRRPEVMASVGDGEPAWHPGNHRSWSRVSPSGARAGAMVSRVNARPRWSRVAAVTSGLVMKARMVSGWAQRGHAVTSGHQTRPPSRAESAHPRRCGQRFGNRPHACLNGLRR
jgi:hypothetical protein